ncbi:hypothetical protein DdX_15326 [Ditylenchus destructor]|uniref:Uncharacterized protein n=1 Tax=Ditylenchus destructor TaxID=166010 RepID=A0AAD4QUX0_9BILA|nr:hypothetical protein DdX_15326 [Ditylenchus destructor]
MTLKRSLVNSVFLIFQLIRLNQAGPNRQRAALGVRLSNPNPNNQNWGAVTCEVSMQKMIEKKSSGLFSIFSSSKTKLRAVEYRGMPEMHSEHIDIAFEDKNDPRTRPGKIQNEVDYQGKYTLFVQQTSTTQSATNALNPAARAAAPANTRLLQSFTFKLDLRKPFEMISKTKNSWVDLGQECNMILKVALYFGEGQ